VNIIYTILYVLYFQPFFVILLHGHFIYILVTHVVVGMARNHCPRRFDKLALILQIHLSTGFSTLRSVFVIVHGFRAIEARLVVSSKFDSNGSIGLPPR